MLLRPRTLITDGSAALVLSRLIVLTVIIIVIAIIFTSIMIIIHDYHEN
jgi:hypothetical protein